MRKFNPASEAPQFRLMRDRLMQSNADRLVKEQERLQIELADRINRRPVPKLHDFLVDAWKTVLHPSEVFRSGWYIEIICEYLTLLTAVKLDKVGKLHLRDRLLEPYDRRWESLSEEMRRLNKLVINISPRCSKSTIVTVVWPCWEWLVLPWFSMMGLSYAQSLASDHNDDRRSLVTSDWYQELCGGMKLSSSKNRITEFKNDQQGLMFGKGLDSAVTGVGAITLSWDDPNNPAKVESDLVRQKTIRDFKDYTITRLNDATLASQVIVQQRTHELDVSGTVFRQFADEWHALIIPMEAERDEQIEFPISKQVKTRKTGDLMAPDRFPPELIAVIKADDRIWAGRYQQRPTAAGGGMFPIRKWRLYNPRSLPNFRRTVLSLDCSFKGSDRSDYNALAIVAESTEFRDVLTPRTYTDPATGAEKNYTERAYGYYILDLWREKAEITGVETALQQYAADYPEAAIKLIEDKANGPAIVSRLQNTLPGITPINPGKSKEERAAAIQPIQSRGDIYLPIAPQYCAVLEGMGLDSLSIEQWWDIYPPEHEADAEFCPVEPWVKDLINEFAKFPNAANDDIVDAIDQAINYMQANIGQSQMPTSTQEQRSPADRNRARQATRRDRARGFR